MEHIRKTYGVPAKRGGRVPYWGRPGRITGSRGPYLLIRLDGDNSKHAKAHHPTFHLQYL
jgi:hypothetical protein